jgi:hypothetical protein
MNFEQQQIFQRFAAVQNLQGECQESTPENWDELHQEAWELIQVIALEPDPESRDDMEAFWGQALAAFGEDWEVLLDEVHEEAEKADEDGQPYHHSGQMYWRVLDRCYHLLQDGEELPFYKDAFRECLACLRATRTLQESLAREALEKKTFGVQGL